MDKYPCSYDANLMNYLPIKNTLNGKISQIIQEEREKKKREELVAGELNTSNSVQKISALTRNNLERLDRSSSRSGALSALKSMNRSSS